MGEVISKDCFKEELDGSKGSENSGMMKMKKEKNPTMRRKNLSRNTMKKSTPQIQMKKDKTLQLHLQTLYEALKWCLTMKRKH